MNNKELEKKQQRQKKVANVFKWVGLGLIGGLLAFGFFGLLAVGAKGCVSKQQVKQQQEKSGQVFIPKALKPYDRIDFYKNGSLVLENGQDSGLWSFLGNSTQDVSFSKTYSFVYDNDIAYDIPYTYVPNVYITSTMSLGRVHVVGYNLNRDINNIKYIGLANTGFIFASVSNPNNITSSNSFTLSIQDMEQGYITDFNFTTDNSWTMEKLTSNDNLIKLYGYQANIADSVHYIYQYFTEDIFDITQSEPVYNDNNLSTEGLNGVFALIYKAFTAIAGILSLNVIAGVSLGTFVFIPLTIGLIIFIVNLFKR